MVMLRACGSPAILLSSLKALGSSTWCKPSALAALAFTWRGASSLPSCCQACCRPTWVVVPGLAIASVSSCASALADDLELSIVNG